MEVDLDKGDFGKDVGGRAGCLCERGITRIDDFQMILFENAIVNDASMKTE
jgi:hypothetical protein